MMDDILKQINAGTSMPRNMFLFNHANRRKMNIVCACIYAAIIAVFYISYSNSGSLNIGNWLYAILVLFGTNVAYCIYIREFGIRLVCKQFQLLCLFNMHWQCLRLVVKETVGS